MRKMTRKGWGRLYVKEVADVGEVRAIVKEIDEFEAGYLPDDLIAPFSEYPRVTYIGKFCDMDIDALIATCWHRGIMVWCFDCGSEEFPHNKVHVP